MNHLISTICATLLAATVAAAQTPKQPNIVLFVVDDLGWTDLGCMGSSYYQTPRIDGLATQGMLFHAAYANGPNCAPSRASLMSGLYTPWHRMFTVGDSARGKPEDRKIEPTENARTLAPIFVTIAETLRRVGYATASIGKWHLTGNPATHGFEVSIAGNQRGSSKGGHFSPYLNPSLSDGPEGEYLTDRLTDEAIAFLREKRDRPFFLYLSHYAVHSPIEAKQDLVDGYEGREAAGGHDNPEYAAMIESVDQSLGRILDQLDASGISENTVVCLVSDNGGVGSVTSMAPLRGEKGTLYEGGIRVPMIIRWPGRVRPGSHCDIPVIGIDLYPTLVEACEILPPREYPLEGKSLMPLLTERGSLERENLYWHFPAYLHNRKGATEPFRTRPCGVIRDYRYKLIEWFEDGELELYDLAEDIGESKNLAKEKPELAAKLHRQLREWRGRVGAQVPSEENPAYRPR